MRSKKKVNPGRRRIMRLVVAFAVVSIALAAASYWFVNIYSVYLVQEFGAEIYVGSIVGMNVDNDMLHFGIVAPGGDGARKMIVYKAWNWGQMITSPNPSAHASL